MRALTFNQINSEQRAKTFNEIVQEENIKRFLWFAKHCNSLEDIRKYNHFHGDDGKFISAAEGIRRETIKAEPLASELVDKVKEVEPKRTSLLQDITKEVGGDMIDLKYAVKEKDSLYKKLSGDIKNKRITAKEAAQKIYDVSRYTMQLKDSAFGEGYQKAVETLERNGNKLMRVKNTLADTEASYRGVNCVFKAQDGSKFELQFHTAESHRVKNLNHVLYEKQRDKDTPIKEKIILGQQMNANARNIPTPKGADKIKNMNNL